MSLSKIDFSVRLARTTEDLRAAQRLRYEVFARELGATGGSVDHALGLERDRFDEVADHLLVLDTQRAGDPVVGVYRLMQCHHARAAGRFYSEEEYDLSPLYRSGRSLLELGRSCLRREYRGGTAMMQLWQGIADYVKDHGIEILFGVASFHGTDPQALAHPLSNLHHQYRAPEALRVRARVAQRMDILPADKVDRRRAMLETPALIKAYLRLGGMVGEGAFVDHGFNTTDVCMVMDTARLNARQKALYAKDAAS
ncbi:GNAT family N-acetyltransferase [Aestuariicoccus sp. MJ-SS9]|uniref:GNAT family N-acetyltransferase n=1 Tax=Aestuariicoccus sp. MJ-SS9 TaxID=3079855 RepID=UPI0029128088|nr:GNAT family N-acyltransferase [Aestuariicoccus sp. MJ-SS9]MDU8913130.1 GNAT family N-acyltransferase [Aestuariicoccus sp. MJ-SS9]